MTILHTPVLGCLTGLFLGALTPSTLASDVHFVPGDFAELQTAIDAAAPGDTIVIDGGDHLYITVGKPITLVGSASNPPRLTVDPGGPIEVTTEPSQAPCLVLEEVGGVVDLVGVDVGGVTGAQTYPNASGIQGSGNNNTLRVLHATLEAPQLTEVSGSTQSNTPVFVLGPSATLVDVEITAQTNLMDGGWCSKSIWNGVSGVFLGQFGGNATVTVLDSHLVGGGALEPVYFPDSGNCTTPMSCADTTGGKGGAGITTLGRLFHAGSEFFGGPGAELIVENGDPQIFPCSLEDGDPSVADSELDLDRAASLSGSGPVVSGERWSLEMDVPRGSFLLLGEAMVTPVEVGAAGQLYVNPNNLVARPLAAGAQTREFPATTLREQLLGKIIAVQIFTPGLGLSRPVLAGLLPQ